MTETSDEHAAFATAREHWRLVERVATVEADMRQIGPALARIETAVATKNMAPPIQQETAAALALHRALDAFDKRTSGSSSSPVLLSLAIIGALAIGAGAMWLLGHH